jgi:hypothetical protein
LFPLSQWFRPFGQKKNREKKKVIESIGDQWTRNYSEVSGGSDIPSWR